MKFAKVESLMEENMVRAPFRPLTKGMVIRVEMFVQGTFRFTQNLL